MKIVAIADLHGSLPNIPDCDLLLIAGDVCPVWDHHYQYQAAWLDNYFRIWLRRAPAKQIVGIAGNHDWIFQTHPNLVPKDLRWIYLENSSCEINGLKIWGTPWTPEFCNWAFNGSAEKMNKVWESLPDHTDIVVSHGPPYGFMDLVDGVKHVGCVHMLDNIVRVRPRLCVFGHIHSNHGRYIMPGIATMAANCTLMNDNYDVVYSPSVFFIENEKDTAIYDCW